MRARQTHDRYASLTWLIVVMTVVVLVIGVIAARYVESRLVASKGESLALAAAEIAHKLDLLLAEQYNDALEFSHTQVFRKRGVAAQSAYLTTVKKIHPIYLWLGVTDAGGRIVAATDPASIGQDRSRSSWFQAARDTGNVHVSDAEPFEETGGTDAVSFTAPIKGAGGEFQGTVTTRVGLPTLEEVVVRTIRTFQTREESGGNLEYKFVTTTGDVFIDSDLFHKGNVNLKRLGLPSALLSESGSPGYFEEEHLHRHVPVVTGYARTQGAGEFPGLKWTVLLRTDKDDLVAPIRSVLWKLAAAWVLVWLPMLGFSLWSAVRLKEEWTHAQDEHAHAATAESKYRQLVDQARDIIYRTDDQGRFTFVNPIVTRIMGYFPQELLGWRFTELIRPDARASAERFYGWQFVRKTPSTYYEFPALTKDGREIWFGQNVQTLLDNGQVAGFHAVARDITERKRTEVALQQSEERFRSVFGHAAIGMALVSTDGRWLQVNPSLCDIVGYSESELLATTFQAITHPDDLDIDLAHVRQMLTGEIRYYQMEKRYIHKRGHSVWILLSVSLVRDAQGNPLHFIGLIKDITERKQTEKDLTRSRDLLKSFVEHAPAAVAMLDKNLRYVAASRRWLQDYHLGEQDLIGRHHYDVFPEIRQRQDWQDIHRRCLAGAVEQRDKDRFVRQDGQEDWLRWEIRPWHDETGEIGGIMMFTEVITERKQTEEALRESEKRFRTIFDQAPLGMAVIDSTTGQFRRINRKYCDIVGYPHKEMLTRTFQDITHPDDLQADLDNMTRMMEGRINTFRMEKRYIRKDGAIIWVNLVCVPLWWDYETEGRFHIAMVEEITERKQAEEVREQLVAELAESRSRFEMFFRQTPSGISITTVKEGRFLDVNKQAELLTGYSREELIGRTTLEMNLYVDPTERAEIVQSLNKTGLLTGLERQIRTKSGEIRTAIFSLVPIQMGSEPCLLSIAHDITERKQAEERLRERSRQQAIQAELSLLAVTTPDLSTLLNTAAGLTANALELDYCEVLELLPNGRDLLLRAGVGWKDDLIGQAKTDVRPSSLAYIALSLNDPVIVQDLPTETRFSGPSWLRDHGIVSGMSVTIHGKEGHWGTLGVYTTRQRRFSRDDINFLQTVSSILATAIERAQAEDVLRNANQALRSLSRQLLRVQEDDRRAIARDLHDEIGQSLTAIKLNVERAQRTSDRAARDRIMKDCVQITDSVLNQVRNISLDLHPSILDDLGLGYALKWYADRQAERAGLKVEVTADPSGPRLPQDVEIACFRIAQEALTNVVRHAQASRASITLKRLAKRVELRIQDDGIGFDVKAVQSPMSGGTSIGLTGMRERARLVGGEVHVTSVPRKGTEVTAIVPLPSVPSADTTTPQAPPP